MSNLNQTAHDSLAKANHSHNHVSYQGVGLFAFVIITLIAFFCLVWFKPDFVLRERHGRKTCEVDYFVAFIGAIVIAIVICVILAILAYALY